MTITESEKAARLEAARARVAAVEAFATALEPEPVKVGQWRKSPGVVFRVDRVEHDGFGFKQAFGDASAAGVESVLATPREVLDAKLATLTPEQRARVTIGPCGNAQSQCILVDGQHCDEVFDGADIDSMLAALDAALAKPAPNKLNTLLSEAELLAKLKEADGPDLRAQLAAVTAERDRWAARVKDLEAHLSAVRAVASNETRGWAQGLGGPVKEAT